ncbi:hypothetical protein BDF20DRAFT_942451, partial [Mycotypha africana]|uniref:uncharacterized protein n=1 Tax=Mycotypha africana TaxID=64632 RepID=UPI002301BADD
MPPGKKGRKPTVNLLSPRQVTYLTNVFAICRRDIACPNCHQTATFHKAGSVTGHPTQPNYICKTCGKNVNAADVDDDPPSSQTVSNVNNQTQLPMEISSNDGSPDTPAQPTPAITNDDIVALRDLIHQLQDEIRQLRAENAALRAAQHSNLTTMQNPTPVYNSQFPALTDSQKTNPTNDSPVHPWRDEARLAIIKQAQQQRREHRQQERQTAAARLFQPPSLTQGFKYLYVPTKARVPIGQLRARLRKLNINNSRILDIHYPTRNVVAFLVHNDYAQELTDQLQQFKISIKHDFDPNDGSILMDPKYEQKTPAERNDLAREHHTARLVRALNFIRTPVKYAVATYFLKQDWIDKDTYASVMANTSSSSLGHTQLKQHSPADIFDIEND